MEKSIIKLSHIPNHIIDTSQFDNMLHGSIVKEFENNFCSYVGADFGVSLNSATNAIHLLCKLYLNAETDIIDLPTLIPPVVCNAIKTAGVNLNFVDYIKWVGRDFKLFDKNGFYIIDSAHRVDRNQFTEYEDNDLVYYSFYPTKTNAGCDGAMIVSNDKSKIDLIRQMTFNGMSQEANNWERKQTMIGYKMYMNSLQAYIANENLKRLDEKKHKISIVREKYNHAFNLRNESEHLYRINVKNRNEFMQRAKDENIVCGVHYECAHLNPIFNQTHLFLEQSELESRTTASIPMHEALTENDIDKIIKLVNG